MGGQQEVYERARPSDEARGPPLRPGIDPLEQKLHAVGGRHPHHRLCPGLLEAKEGVPQDVEAGDGERKASQPA